MTAFNVGDKVVRKHALRDCYWDSICERYDIEVDEPLTVTWIGEHSIQINGHAGFLSNPAKFEHWVPTPVAEHGYDAVKQPKHYMLLDTEAITLIAASLTEPQFYGYCLGNILKYRLRAGKKDELVQDIGKADEYELLYEKYKHLCKVTLVEANNG